VLFDWLGCRLVAIQYQGCDTDFMRLDFEAIDTLSNFTSTCADIERAGFRRVAVITSSWHMPRALSIAALLLPAYGVTRKCLQLNSSSCTNLLILSLKWA
jgi:hypothetical protein